MALPQVLPDYGGGSIANLMRSIGDACGAAPLPYPALRGLDVEELRAARNLVLIVIDGMGAQLLRGAAAGGTLRGYVRDEISSVFPSTTASAVTTFLTGLAPQQHAVTGWHVYFEELEAIAAALPLTPREPGKRRWNPHRVARKLFGHPSFFSRLARDSFVVSPLQIVDSAFNVAHSQGARRIGYAGAAQLFDQLAALIDHPGNAKYIHAYYGTLDALAHDFGIGSGEVETCLARLDAACAAFFERIAGSGTLVLITADHGFIDAPATRLLELAAHPRLAAMLERPLCGERRVAYCYVRPERRDDFAAYVSENLSHALSLHRAEELIGAGWYGPGAPHPRLARRIGDYVLVMSENWTIKDALPGEKPHAMIGVHGGLSEQEMRAPLIVYRA